MHDCFFFFLYLVSELEIFILVVNQILYIYPECVLMYVQSCSRTKTKLNLRPRLYLRRLTPSAQKSGSSDRWLWQIVSFTKPSSSSPTKTSPATSKEDGTFEKPGKSMISFTEKSLLLRNGYPLKKLRRWRPTRLEGWAWMKTPTTASKMLLSPLQKWWETQTLHLEARPPLSRSTHCPHHRPTPSWRSQMEMSPLPRSCQRRACLGFLVQSTLAMEHSSCACLWCHPRFWSWSSSWALRGIVRWGWPALTTPVTQRTWKHRWPLWDCCGTTPSCGRSSHWMVPIITVVVRDLL